MSLWLMLDLIVIGIYIVAVLFFRKKGFLKASETIISLLLTICLMSTALPFFKGIISESAIGEKIHTGVSEFLIPKEGEKTEEGVGDKESALPDFLQEAVEDNMQKLDEAKNDMLTATAEQTSSAILQILSVILLFLLVKLGIFLAFRILEIVCRLKLLNFVNRSFGTILGIINATIIIYVLCAALVVFVPAESAAPIKDAIGQTMLAQFFYNNNILMKIFI